MSRVTRPASRTLPDLLDELAAHQPDHELIVGAGKRLSYGETRDRVRRLAQGRASRECRNVRPDPSLALSGELLG